MVNERVVHGRIQAADRRGAGPGSRISDEGVPKSASPDPDQVPETHRRRNRVLIVEDSQLVRERLVSLILGIEPDLGVDQAAHGVEAIRLFRLCEPFAVLLDIELPGIDGLELLAQFKRARPGCMVVVLTTYAFDAVRQRCGVLGADHFFDKARDFSRAIDVITGLYRSLDRKGTA